MRRLSFRSARGGASCQRGASERGCAAEGGCRWQAAKDIEEFLCSADPRAQSEQARDSWEDEAAEGASRGFPGP